jgi:hypothetical protein
MRNRDHASHQVAEPSIDLGIVIVSWNVREHLNRCLASLYLSLNLDAMTTQVWVVDNASSDGTPEMVEKIYPWVHLETPAKNLGYVKGNNLAMRRLVDQTRYMWLLNPDTLVQPGVAQTLLGFMDDHPKAGLAGPKLLNPNGTLQESAFGFPGLIQALYALELLPARFYYTPLNGRYPPDRYAGTTPFRIGHPLGAAMLARSQAVREVGLLDEGFFMYCEEIDWAWRMRKAGWQRWLVPAAEIFHVGGASTQQARPQSTAHLWESRARLYRKHRGRLVRGLVTLAVRRVFKRRKREAESPAWEQAYTRILNAWQRG